MILCQTVVQQMKMNTSWWIWRQMHNISHVKNYFKFPVKKDTSNVTTFQRVVFSSWMKTNIWCHVELENMLQTAVHSNATPISSAQKAIAYPGAIHVMANGTAKLELMNICHNVREEVAQTCSNVANHKGVYTLLKYVMAEIVALTQMMRCFVWSQCYFVPENVNAYWQQSTVKMPICQWICCLNIRQFFWEKFFTQSIQKSNCPTAKQEFWQWPIPTLQPRFVFTCEKLGV